LAASWRFEILISQTSKVDLFSFHKMAEKIFIEARQERYRESHNSLDAERFSELFADDAEYSDNGISPFVLETRIHRGQIG